MFKNLRKKKKGFTLIELIIVIAILAILAAVAIPRLGGFTKSANDKADLANAKTIANATAILKTEGTLKAGTYTIDKDNADTAATGTATGGDIIEGYLENVPTPSAGGTFGVVIDAAGDISVTVGSKVIYPN